MTCVRVIRDLTRCLLSYVYREVFLCTASWVYRGRPQFLRPISWTMKTIRPSRPCLRSPSLYPSSGSSGPCLPPLDLLSLLVSCTIRVRALHATLLSLSLSLSPLSPSLSRYFFPPLCTARTLRMVKTTIHTQIQKVRTIAQPNPGFMRQLEQYQCLLEQQTTAAGAKKSVGVGIHLARKSVNHTDNLAI